MFGSKYMFLPNLIKMLIDVISDVLLIRIDLYFFNVSYSFKIISHRTNTYSDIKNGLS